MKTLLALACGGVMMGVALFTSGGGPDRPKDTFTKPMTAIGAIHPRVSPDGKWIAVSYQGAIWVVSTAGGRTIRLTDGDAFDMEPAWSPDSKRLAFVHGGELQMIEATDGKPVPLPKPIQVKGTYNFQKLEFHPDGPRILSVFRSQGKDHGLAWFDLDKGGIEPLDVTLGGTGRFALSQDGKWIVTTKTMDDRSEQMGNDGPQADLWKMPANGGKPEKIVRFPSRVHDLCWDAAGKSLVVVSELGGAHYDLWQVPLADPLGGMRKLTAGQADEDRPSISNDGKLLVYSDNRHGATLVTVRAPDTGKETFPIEWLDFRAPTGAVKLKILDQDTKKSIVARISLTKKGGAFFAPTGALYRVLRGAGHFYGDGTGETTLPAGKYRLRVFRGPEYKAASRDFVIEKAKTLELTVELARWTHAAKEGWYSGENHIHANYGYGQWYNTPETMLQQCAGEDLNVCNFMVANSDTDGVFDRAFFRGRPDPLSTPETILYWNQEFRSTLWGHMTLVNLRQVVEPVFTGFKDTTNPWDIPTNADIADRTHWQKGHVNYTHAVQNAAKPFENPYAAKALPIDVALGKVDSLDLNNAYAGTVPIWYRLLNCGFRVPGSAGTDVFLNRIFSQLPGGDRVYVNMKGPLTYEGWIDGLKKGRTFVTNGPMLELTLDGQGLGDAVKIPRPMELKVQAKARSQFPMAKVELVFNGEVIATLPLAKDNLSAELAQAVEIKKSGWLALRAQGPGHADSPLAALYAHTSPIYVEVAGAPVRSKADARFFLAWIDDLAVLVRGRDRLPNDELRRHVQDQLEAARTVYTRLLKDE